MAKSKPIPVKLNDDIIQRLDAVSSRSGLNNRSAVIKFCLVTFLNHLESQAEHEISPDWHKILRELDGRTHRYQNGIATAKPTSASAKNGNHKRRPRSPQNGYK